MVFRSNEDIYHFVNEIMTLAKTNNDSKTMMILQDAIDRGGFLHSERLGELLIAFKEFERETNKEYIFMIHDDIKAAIQYINKAFKRANRPRW